MIALFVLKLSAGITLMWWLMPRREVTDGFFRIQMRVVLGLAVLAALLLTRGGTWEVPANPQPTAAAAESTSAESTESADSDNSNDTPAVSEVAAHENLEFARRWQFRIQILTAVVAYAGSVVWALGRRLPGNICIHLMMLACCGSLGLHSWLAPGSCTGLQFLSDFSSAAVCGSVLTGMLLGHWYLTTPTMSIRPLWWFDAVIAVAACLRLAASATALVMEGTALPGMTHWIWLGIRWTGTIVAPLAVSIVVWRILRYRNTQSATGVLFAGLILVMMGEMSGALLERDLQIPY